jgi:hypothetical protein
VTGEREEGDRNALLALHFEEGDRRVVAAARAHALVCPRCQEYLGLLSDVEVALHEWADEPPPPGLADRVLSQAVRSTQPAPAAPVPSAMPLIGLLPVIALMLASVRHLGGWLAALPIWSALEGWPAVEWAAPFGTAVVVLFVLGGLASLAAAPALVLESGERRR